MNDRHDEKLEAMLKARPIEPASSDLAQRIILKSQSIPQRTAVSPWQWLQELFSEFHLAKPAYILAGTLLLGFVIGFSAPLGTSPANDADTAQVENFLYANEGVL